MNETFTAKRAVWKYTQTIEAGPSDVFPLLCPVREAEWLDGWRYKMIYSQSGVAEAGCVFTTPGQGEADTVWVISRHDQEKLRVEFARFTPENRVCTLGIQVEDAGPKRSFVHIAYVYTGISDAGNRFIDGFTEERFLSAVRFWEDAMNHFLKTGEKLARET
ncbi:MAG: hypothetical protein JEZ11_06680 [Desulfobacterales bacterium]|nr:hypothetical protein [Desulfobacterales bacterium]